MADWWLESAAAVHRSFMAGERSASDIVDGVLDRIAAYDQTLGAFLEVADDRAEATARQLDRRRLAGEPLGPLAGVPIALKDNLATEGLRTTAGSALLANWLPPYSATVVRRLEAADALIIGKTNLDEFAMGSSTEHSAFQRTNNPYDADLVPGGSSGGSAAAVAAGLVPVALGSETGGSVRQPAAYCGVVGLKPTYGRVSRYGLIAFASSLDQVGPLGRTVGDVADVLSVIAGVDPEDPSTCLEPVPDYRAALGGGVQGWRVAMPEELLKGADAKLQVRAEQAFSALVAAGALPVSVRLPHLEAALATYYVIAPAEASSNLSRFDGVRFGVRQGGDGELAEMYSQSRGRGFGPEVKRRIMIGTYALSAGYVDAFYVQAQRLRQLLAEDFATAFSMADILVTPTTPSLPFRFGAHDHDPLAMYANDALTLPANLVGVPAISVPAGRADDLPVGIQLMAPAFAELALLQAAQVVEDHFGPAAAITPRQGGGQP
jgi:aspartyl-tRNA(Asn)/glutamyl-tRNA(Gln) amidotransferase subunit A